MIFNGVDGSEIEKTALEMVSDSLSQETEYYRGRKNPDWSDEKNAGFREGIKYSKEFVDRIKKQNY